MATKSSTPTPKKTTKAAAKADAKLETAAKPSSHQPVAETGSEQTQFQGRGAFIVETTSAGVAVAATVVTEDGRALAMPAIFPNLTYALSQIDEMRALVIRHFDQASQIGTQVIAQQLVQSKD